MFINNTLYGTEMNMFLLISEETLLTDDEVVSLFGRKIVPLTQTRKSPTPSKRKTPSPSPTPSFRNNPSPSPTNFSSSKNLLMAQSQTSMKLIKEPVPLVPKKYNCNFQIRKYHQTLISQLKKEAGDDWGLWQKIDDTCYKSIFHYLYMDTTKE